MRRGNRAPKRRKIKHHNKLSDLTKEWIDNYPKIINSNGCWIPNKIPSGDGYIQVMIERMIFRLHRLVVAIYHNLDYHDYSWYARHNKGCDTRCFWIEHLQPGTMGDNARDMVEHGTHRNTSKEVCPKCGGAYVTKMQEGGWGKGEIHRHCPTCRAIYNAEREKNNRRNK